MNGADRLCDTLLAHGVDVVLRQSGHVGDAFRGGARPPAADALRPRPLRRRGDRGGRRLRPHGRPARRDAAPYRPGPRQRPRQPAQRPAGPHADRQYRRRPRLLSPALRRAADERHRALWRGPCRTGCIASPGRTTSARRAAAACRAARTPAGDRDPDPAGRCRLGRGAVDAARPVPQRRRPPRPASPKPSRDVARRCEPRPGPFRPGPRRPRGARRRARRSGPHRAATGARLFGEMFIARAERGRGRVPLERIPYPVDEAVAALRDIDVLVLVGAPRPSPFSPIRANPSRCCPGRCQRADAGSPGRGCGRRRSTPWPTSSAAPRAVAPPADRPSRPGRPAPLTDDAIAAIVARRCPTTRSWSTRR